MKYPGARGLRGHSSKDWEHFQHCKGLEYFKYCWWGFGVFLMVFGVRNGFGIFQISLYSLLGKFIVTFWKSPSPKSILYSTVHNHFGLFEKTVMGTRNRKNDRKNLVRIIFMTRRIDGHGGKIQKIESWLHKKEIDSESNLIIILPDNFHPNFFWLEGTISPIHLW